MPCLAGVPPNALHISRASPFSRKCRVVAREKGLADQVEEVTADFPYEDAGYTRINPLGQARALETGEGVLFNRPVICAYLDTAGWRVRQLQSLHTAPWS